MASLACHYYHVLKLIAGLLPTSSTSTAPRYSLATATSQLLQLIQRAATADRQQQYRQQQQRTQALSQAPWGVVSLTQAATAMAAGSGAATASTSPAVQLLLSGLAVLSSHGSSGSSSSGCGSSTGGSSTGGRMQDAAGNQGSDATAFATALQRNEPGWLVISEPMHLLRQLLGSCQEEALR